MVYGYRNDSFNGVNGEMEVAIEINGLVGQKKQENPHISWENRCFPVDFPAKPPLINGVTP